MLPLTLAKHRFTHVIDITSLPEEFHQAIERFGAAHEESCVDYHDGDYHLALDFSLLTLDTTPDEQIALFEQHFDGRDETLAELYDDEKYPYAGFKKQGLFFTEYLGWIKALRHIAANIPPELVKPDTCAIWVWQ